MTPSTEVDYSKYLHLLLRKKALFAVISLAIMTAALVASYMLPKKYEGKSTVFIEKSVISDLVKGIAVTPSVEDKIKVLTYALNSRTLIVKVIDELDLGLKKQNDAEMEKLVEEFQKNTVIKIKDKEGLFTISFTHENPRIARDYINTLVRRYIEANISSKREESYGATKFLSEQIDTFKEKLDQAESQVNQFKQEKGTLLATDSATVQRDLSEAQLKLEEIRAKKNQLISTKMLMKKTDPLLERQAALQKKLEELRLAYTDSFPEVIRVKTELEATREQIGKNEGREEKTPATTQDIARIDIELNSLNSYEESLRAQIAANRALMRGIPVAKAGLEQLEQDRSNRKNIYEQLYARHGQSEVSKQMEVQDKATTFRIVDPAVMPVQPVSPNRVRMMLMGILAGLAGGLAAVLAVDHLDRSVKTVDAVKALGIPVLAIIPKVSTPQEELLTRKRDLRLYAASGLYLSVILVILATEALDFSVVDKILGRISIMWGA